MIRPERADGYDVVICYNEECRGWGTIVSRQDTGDGYALVEHICPDCKGSGRKLVKSNYKNLIDNVMNKNLEEMPTGIDVQLKVLVLLHNTEIWTMGKKSASGEIAVAGFAADKCEILGWRLIE